MRNVIQWDLNSFFSKNLQKSPSGWGLCPQTPVCDTLQYTSLLNTSPKLDIYTFYLSVFAPLPLSKSWFSAIRLRLQIFHSTISLPHNKFLFRKFLMTSLYVICGLGLPIKNSGYAYARALLPLHVLLHLVIFMTKQKPPRNIFEWIISLFTAKVLQEAMYLTFPYLDQITYKIQPQNATI